MFVAASVLSSLESKSTQTTVWCAYFPAFLLWLFCRRIGKYIQYFLYCHKKKSVSCLWLMSVSHACPCKDNVSTYHHLKLITDWSWGWNVEAEREHTFITVCNKITKALLSLSSSVILLMGLQMKLNLSFKEQLPELAVRGFAHSFRLHAHLVLVWRELIRAALLVPQVEKAARRTANHHQLTVKVLPVKVHVLQPPAFGVTVKTTCQEEERFIQIWRGSGRAC